nr:FG-GAP-like repeat-containing protein [Promineifilum sp.]
MIVNNDGAGEGFNDTTAAAPVGGNPGTTLGAQRLNAFQAAADVWGALLVSNVTIRVAANFDPLSCTATSGTLGSAGPTFVYRDFSGAPQASTFYWSALANALAGTDLNTSADDISATFSSNIGTTGCLESSGWYFGLDGNSPGNRIDFVSVLIHELGHGLGFSTGVNLGTGAKLSGFDDAFIKFLEHHGATPSDYPSMSNAQRVTASTANGNLHWTGANVRAAAGILTNGAVGDHVRMYAPTTQKPGSSVSHWDEVLSPNQVMEWAYTEPLHKPALELPAFRDMGWPMANFTISVSASPGAGGTVGGGGSAGAGTMQTVTASANSGYTFSNWTEGATVVSTSASYTFLVTGARTLVANFTSSGGAPAAPVATAATNVATTSFTANWNSVGGATGYRIDVATDSGFASILYNNVDLGNVTSFGIAALTPSTPYYYRVRAYNGSGTSGNSNVISVTTAGSAPANDNFANATTLSGNSGTTTGSNVGATKESGEPNHASNVGGKSVWWKWTAPGNGNVTFTTSGSTFDTLMGIYTGGAVNTLTLIASNDDESYPTVTTSLLSINVTSGTTYYIAVDGFNDNNGAAIGSVALAWNFSGAGASLSVSPSTNMVSLGSQGGPFKPSSFSYTLSASSGTVNWSVSGLPDWLTASATSGSAGTGGTTVTFSVNTNALSKAVGTYGPTTVTFTNTTNNQGTTTRTAGLTVSPNACEAIARGPEFDGGAGAKGDILWRSDTGAIGMWFMNGTALSSGPGLGTVATDWRLIGAADFNGDGKSDLLWRNRTSGQVAVWFSSGVTVTGTVGLGTVGADWQIVGAADFDGDHVADILWRHDTGTLALWHGTGGTGQGRAVIGSVDMSWRIAGLGDFDGDGKSDILWRSTSGVV